VDELESLVEAVLGTRKYRCVSEDVVRAVGRRELARRTSWKEAVKASKRKLHQVGAAYQVRAPAYGRWLADLSAAESRGDSTGLRSACRQAMEQHSSTRERLPILEQFFARTLGGVQQIESVLDIACGLNPLAIPWMPLARGARYEAYDIYEDMVAFLNQSLGFLGVRGQAFARDVVQSPPRRPARLALILKSLPCLDRLHPDGSERLLSALRADVLLVSFPLRSLGGKAKGMDENYARRFGDLVLRRGWDARRFEFANELAFLVHK
jgi:16S rRNA (guanine(1405)-N(7))-methyltransferase